MPPSKRPRQATLNWLGSLNGDDPGEAYLEAHFEARGRGQPFHTGLDPQTLADELPALCSAGGEVAMSAAWSLVAAVAIAVGRADHAPGSALLSSLEQCQRHICLELATAEDLQELSEDRYAVAIDALSALLLNITCGRAGRHDFAAGAPAAADECRSREVAAILVPFLAGSLHAAEAVACASTLVACHQTSPRLGGLLIDTGLLSAAAQLLATLPTAVTAQLDTAGVCGSRDEYDDDAMELGTAALGLVWEVLGALRTDDELEAAVGAIASALSPAALGSLCAPAPRAAPCAAPSAAPSARRSRAGALAGVLAAVDDAYLACFHARFDGPGAHTEAWRSEAGLEAGLLAALLGGGKDDFLRHGFDRRCVHMPCDAPTGSAVRGARVIAWEELGGCALDVASLVGSSVRVPERAAAGLSSALQPGLLSRLAASDAVRLALLLGVDLGRRAAGEGLVCGQDVRVVRQGAAAQAGEVPAPPPPRSDELAFGTVLTASLAASALDQGYSVVLRSAQLQHAGLGALARALEHDLGLLVTANVYATPRAAPLATAGEECNKEAGARRQGLAPHSDDHDVLVVQLRGRKTWRLATTLDAPLLTLPARLRPRPLFSEPPPLFSEPLCSDGAAAVPLPHFPEPPAWPFPPWALPADAADVPADPRRGDAFSAAGCPVLAAAALDAAGACRVTLGPGDALYVPRGVAHEAFTEPVAAEASAAEGVAAEVGESGESLHVSLGLEPDAYATWRGSIHLALLLLDTPPDAQPDAPPDAQPDAPPDAQPDGTLGGCLPDVDGLYHVVLAAATRDRASALARIALRHAPTDGDGRTFAWALVAAAVAVESLPPGVVTTTLLDDVKWVWAAAASASGGGRPGLVAPVVGSRLPRCAAVKLAARLRREADRPFPLATAVADWQRRLSRSLIARHAAVCAMMLP